MANDAANDVTYYLATDIADTSDLAGIRQWNNLKIGFAENQVWVKDFDYVQIHSVEVKSIPWKTLFYAKNGKLFLLNSHLPDRNIPALLWTPIDRALPVRLPSLNHNYFGIHDTIEVRVVASAVEEEAVAMIATLATLGLYLETAPAVRLEKIRWAILNQDRALLVGRPLLPVSGEVYWKRGDHLLPAGYNLNVHLLAATISTKLNPDGNCLVGWNTDSSYFLVEKSDLQQLSLGSFRESVGKIDTGTR